METPSRLEFCLHAWGANSYGQLGQGHAEDQCVPRLSSALQGRAVRSMSGGGGHSVVITESGEVLVCGQNDRGQLGLGHNINILTLQLCPVLNQRVTYVACGWDFTLLLTGCYQLLACGSNTFGQLGVGETTNQTADLVAVVGLKEPIVSVAAGLRHSLAVNDSGCVYQWGTGLFSHAKRALSPHSVPSHLCSRVPCLVPGLNRKKTQLVAAGSAHCACLTEEGDLFLWGSNKHGQLITADAFLPTPTLLKPCLFKEEKVLKVWSGWTHNVAQTVVLLDVVRPSWWYADITLDTVALDTSQRLAVLVTDAPARRAPTISPLLNSESGRVFTWGRGDYGQLGRGVSSSQKTEQHSDDSVAESGIQTKENCLPEEIKVLNGAAQISCGSEHNLAIVGGCLLSWGWNEHGMCGDGSQADVFQPRRISDLRPVLVGCGAGHSMAVCAVSTGSRQD